MSTKKQILIADDVAETVELLKCSLEMAEYEVIVARSGEEALNLAQKHLPQLIILDLMMPKMDGYTVNLKLKENEKTKNIPVIMSTAQGFMSKIFNLTEKTKVDAFLEKPYSVEELWSKVEEILGKK